MGTGLLVLWTALGLWASEPGFSQHVRFTLGPLDVLMINYEVPRGKPYLIVHFEIRNPTRQEHRCDGRSLASLRRADGSVLDTSYDLLVDQGQGGTRAVGPFLVPPRGKVRASMMFLLGPDDLPGQLELPDGRRSLPIHFRGQSRSSLRLLQTQATPT